MYDTPNSSFVPLQKNRQIPIRRTDGKVVGEVNGEIFRKHVKGSRHMLRSPRAWAVDKATLEAAKQAGATIVEIIDTESTAVFRSTIFQLEMRGFTFNRGFGLQVGLLLERWIQVKDGEQVLRQLPMFGGAA